MLRMQKNADICTVITTLLADILSAVLYDMVNTQIERQVVLKDAKTGQLDAAAITLHFTCCCRPSKRSDASSRMQANFRANAFNRTSNNKTIKLLLEETYLCPHCWRISNLSAFLAIQNLFFEEMEIKLEQRHHQEVLFEEIPKP